MITRADIDVYEADDSGGFEVWAGGVRLFNLATDREDVLMAALVAYDAGMERGQEVGRLKWQAEARRLFGAARDIAS